MCIRDRLVGKGVHLHALERLPDNPTGWQKTWKAIGLIFVTVSYTHLRAHETVLDLVCRLLLEKQKQLSTNTNIYDITTKHIVH